MYDTQQCLCNCSRNIFLKSKWFVAMVMGLTFRILCSCLMLTNLCPQPGSGAAAPLPEGEHEEGVQTHSLDAVCGAGEGLSLGCVC